MENEMENAAMRRFCCLRRCVKCEWPHEQRLTAHREACDLAVIRYVSCDFSPPQDSVSVCSWRDTQRSVGFAAFVQVKAHGE